MTLNKIFQKLRGSELDRLDWLTVGAVALGLIGWLMIASLTWSGLNS
jgi:hypothetical protein